MQTTFIDVIVLRIWFILQFYSVQAAQRKGMAHAGSSYPVAYLAGDHKNGAVFRFRENTSTGWHLV